MPQKVQPTSRIGLPPGVAADGPRTQAVRARPARVCVMCSELDLQIRAISARIITAHPSVPCIACRKCRPDHHVSLCVLPQKEWKGVVNAEATYLCRVVGAPGTLPIDVGNLDGDIPQTNRRIWVDLWLCGRGSRSQKQDSGNCGAGAKRRDDQFFAVVGGVHDVSLFFGRALRLGRSHRYEQATRNTAHATVKPQPHPKTAEWLRSAWGAVLPIEAGKESVVPRNRLRRNVSQSSDASEADCPATGFVSKKLSAFADGWMRRRSGIPVRPASSKSRRRGYNFDARGLGTGQDAWQGDDRHGRGPLGSAGWINRPQRKRSRRSCSSG